MVHFGSIFRSIFQIFLNFFGIDFCIDFCIDFHRFRLPFWDPWAAIWRQLGSKRRPKSAKWRQNVDISRKMVPPWWGPGADLFPRAPPIAPNRSQARFLMNFGPIWAPSFEFCHGFRAELRRNSKLPKHETQGQEPTTNLTSFDKIRQDQPNDRQA